MLQDIDYDSVDVSNKCVKMSKEHKFCITGCSKSDVRSLTMCPWKDNNMQAKAVCKCYEQPKIEQGIVKARTQMDEKVDFGFKHFHQNPMDKLQKQMQLLGYKVSKEDQPAGYGFTMRQFKDRNGNVAVINHNNGKASYIRTTGDTAAKNKLLKRLNSW